MIKFRIVFSLLVFNHLPLLDIKLLLEKYDEGGLSIFICVCFVEKIDFCEIMHSITEK